MADFDILDRPLMWIPVPFPGLSQPVGDEVAVAVTHEIELQVEILDREAFAKWYEQLEEDGANRDSHSPERELAIFKAVVRNWRRVRANGRPVEFNDENALRLLSWPNFVIAFGAAYFKAWRGQGEARLGNSASSPAGGRAGEATAGTKADATSTS